MTRQDVEREFTIKSGTTDQIEKTLEDLIRCHGAARVRADLSVLLPRAKWQDWQRLCNLTDNINRRLIRQAENTTQQ